MIKVSSMTVSDSILLSLEQMSLEFVFLSYISQKEKKERGERRRGGGEKTALRQEGGFRLPVLHKLREKRGHCNCLELHLPCWPPSYSSLDRGRRRILAQKRSEGHVWDKEVNPCLVPGWMWSCSKEVCNTVGGPPRRHPSLDNDSLACY